jgi:hypothetical protein
MHQVLASTGGRNSREAAAAAAAAEEAGVARSLLGGMSSVDFSTSTLIAADRDGLRELSVSQVRTRLKNLVERGLAEYERGRGWKRTAAGAAALRVNSLEVGPILSAELERVDVRDLRVESDGYGYLKFTGVAGDIVPDNDWRVLLRLLGMLDDNAGERAFRLVLAVYNLGHDSGYQDAEDDEVSAAMAASY